MDLREAADGGEILRREAKDLFQLFLGLFVAADFDERPTERDARGQIRWMPLQARLTRRDSRFELPGATVFLGKSREGDRRRVHLDPASQFFDAGAFGHCTDGPKRLRPRAAVYHRPPTSINRDRLRNRFRALPRSSVTVSVTVNVNRCVYGVRRLRAVGSGSVAEVPAPADDSAAWRRGRLRAVEIGRRVHRWIRRRERETAPSVRCLRHVDRLRRRSRCGRAHLRSSSDTTNVPALL